MNPRRGITATSAAVRCRRRSGEARAIRRGAASAALWRQARAEILSVVPLSLQPHQLWIVVKSCLSVKVEPPLAVASQTLTASHFSRGLVAWGCGRNAISGKRFFVHSPTPRSPSRAKARLTG